MAFAFSSKPFTNVVKRDGSRVPWEQRKITRAIKKAILALDRRPSPPSIKQAERQARLLTEEVVKDLSRKYRPPEGSTDNPPHVEAIQDTVLDALHQDMGRGSKAILHDPERVWMAYMLYREGRRFVREGHLSEKEFGNQSALLEMIARIGAWNRKHHCGTVKELNQWFRGGNGHALAELVQEAERAKTEELIRVAEHLRNTMLDREIRAIIITGPSSSGKTTTTRRATGFFSKMEPGLTFKPIELDNYFKGLDSHETISYEVDGNRITDVNFELPQSYDIALINEHLEKLLRGETVMMPHYDFSKGIRHDNHTPFQLGKNEILLIDCMHAISPEVTLAIPPYQKVRVYIEAMNLLEDNNGDYLRWTDIRLMRRMLRDGHGRGHPLEKTLMHWHLVRKGERFLFPYLSHADVVINGGLPYELPVLKHFLGDGITAMLPLFERNPDLFDGRERAKRVTGLLSQLETATAGQIGLVPSNSILREFIGGSEFF